MIASPAYVSNCNFDYHDHGCCYLRNSLDKGLLNQIEDSICDLIWSAVSRLPSRLADQFNSYGFSKDQLPHLGLIKLFELSPKHQQIVVDGLLVSPAIYRLLLDSKLTSLISSALSIHPSHLAFTNVFVRVDLPSRFTEHSKLIELPAHQESGYYRSNLDFVNGCVVWAPLFDCKPDDGALYVWPSSHKLGNLDHDSKFLLPNESKHRRVYVDPSKLKDYSRVQLSTTRGDCALQHFSLVHQSAHNLSTDKVRYTILMRTCELTSHDFIPKSW